LLRRLRAAKALAEVQASRSAFGKPLAAEGRRSRQGIDIQLDNFAYLLRS